MAAESKTPFVRYEYSRFSSEPEAKEFVRETASCLFDARGRKTSKSTRWGSWHESREQVEAMIAARLQRKADTKFARKVGEHAKELVEALTGLLADCGEHSVGCKELAPGFDDSRCCPVHVARALLQQIRGEA